MLLVTKRRLQRSSYSHKIQSISSFKDLLTMTKGGFASTFYFCACRGHGNLYVQIPLPIILSNISAQCGIRPTVPMFSSPGMREKFNSLFLCSLHFSQSLCKKHARLWRSALCGVAKHIRFLSRVTATSQDLDTSEIYRYLIVRGSSTGSKVQIK